MYPSTQVEASTRWLPGGMLSSGITEKRISPRGILGGAAVLTTMCVWPRSGYPSYVRGFFGSPVLALDSDPAGFWVCTSRSCRLKQTDKIAAGAHWKNSRESHRILKHC
jgi:hypothetical protein